MIYDVVKVQEMNKSQLMITIPQELSRTLKIAKGDKLAYLLMPDGKIELQILKEDKDGN